VQYRGARKRDLRGAASVRWDSQAPYNVEPARTPPMAASGAGVPERWSEPSWIDQGLGGTRNQ
jgi:hypothetical protein